VRVSSLVVFGLLILAGCSRLGAGAALPAGPANARSALQTSPDAGLLTLYSFKGRASGGEPEGALVNVQGTLYGTTSSYGAGYGTVFAISPLGKFRTVHKFIGTPDGAYPLSDLVLLNGQLYGTTSAGGKYGGGTVFAISQAGGEHVVYNFGKLPDGVDPESRLLAENGILYGTTRQGGKHGRGTVFAVSQGGAESVLHSFAGAPADGGHPGGGLTRLKDWFYGVTLAGGKTQPGGAIYKINALGQEKLLHSFDVTRGDGKGPSGTLLYYDGVFFGTTHGGGTFGRGTIYEMTPQGHELVIHSFGSKLDGAFPDAGLTLNNGELFGTTIGGGYSPRRANECISSGDVRNEGYYRCGTVFRTDPFGTEHVVYRFRGDPNGANPEAGLRSVGGILYGTTFWGGSAQYYGTVFRLVL
jgi:uncharacterized repeat protein (TIGR03803 family)